MTPLLLSLQAAQLPPAREFCVLSNPAIKMGDRFLPIHPEVALAFLTFSTHLPRPGLDTHREMTSEGRFLGTALESTQKAVSLVQEQLGGQGGVFGGLLALACSIRPKPSMDRASIQGRAPHPVGNRAMQLVSCLLVLPPVLAALRPPLNGLAPRGHRNYCRSEGPQSQQTRRERLAQARALPCSLPCAAPLGCAEERGGARSQDDPLGGRRLRRGRARGRAGRRRGSPGQPFANGRKQEPAGLGADSSASLDIQVCAGDSGVQGCLCAGTRAIPEATWLCPALPVHMAFWGGGILSHSPV